jgi:NADH dehydrogenase (ubiquinone) 1 alpha subcomplex subunit 5
MFLRRFAGPLLAGVKATTGIVGLEKIEEKIQGGQVEELIVQAQDELQLIPKMAEWKPWEVSEDYKVEIIEDDDSVPSHIPIHRPRH